MATGTISSAGIGSGLDVASLVSGLMQVEQGTLTNLKSQASSYQSKLSAYGQISSKLSALQTAARALKRPADLVSLSGTVVDTKVAAVSVGSGAVAGDYSLEVSQLARAQRTASAPFSSTTASVATGAGSLHIAFGTYNSTGNSFTANADRAAIDIAIPADQMTPIGIRNAINAGKQGVTASLINDASGTRLVITNDKTGENQAMKITATDPDGNDTDNAGLSSLAYDPTATAGSGKNATLMAAAQNAKFTLDGMSMSSTTNSVADVIDGVTLTLSGTNVGEPTTLSVTQDSGTALKSINALIDAYNAANSTMRSLTAYNASTKTAGALNGDAAVRGIQQQLRSTLTSAFGSGSMQRLADAGITIQTDGSLKLDSTKFNAAFKADNDAVTGLFTQDASGTAGKGLGGALDTLITSITGSTGVLAARTDGLNASIKRNSARQDAENTRLATVQASYQSQFTKLDTIVSQNNATMSYLTTQLAKL
ncbi:flagellar filament capping protein FliD [Derxia gummosa]|uniref:Flagellar hook-associated protein 2 n=1 Tax=Derxia gummosa DSM 723 TaxID=1121388 RepID=A0A8B6X7M1_9BURK|nr:flagellar filament capping protein FliD [Derxia gummosa]